jgi:hypothetical protein
MSISVDSFAAGANQRLDKPFGDGNGDTRARHDLGCVKDLG